MRTRSSPPRPVTERPDEAGSRGWQAVSRSAWTRQTQKSKRIVEDRGKIRRNRHPIEERHEDLPEIPCRLAFSGALDLGHPVRLGGGARQRGQRGAASGCRERLLAAGSPVGRRQGGVLRLRRAL